MPKISYVAVKIVLSANADKKTKVQLMPNLPDADVLLIGTVLNTSPTYGYDSEANKRTDEVTGQRATILTNQGGVALVKFDNEDFDLADVKVGFPGAWYVRNSHYSQGQGGMSTKFVRNVGAGDVDFLTSYVGNK